MRFGVTIFLTDYSIDPAEMGREVEARGFESLFLPQHTHIPTSRRTPFPGGATLPDEYVHVLDPFVALSWAAAATRTLRVGTGSCLVAQNDPIILAKQVASLDHLSGGRFVFGVGFGWNVEQAEDHGVPYSRRREVVREKVLAMKALWMQEEASFDGEFVSFEPSWMWPKPVTEPHPPVYVAGAGGPRLFRHLAEWGDGWIPVGGRGIKDKLPEMHQVLERAGRDPSDVKVIPFNTVPDAGKLEYFATFGIDEVVLGIEPGPRDVVLRTLDDYVATVQPLRT